MKKPVALVLGLLLLILLGTVVGGMWYLNKQVYRDPADVIAAADAIWPLKIPADMPPDIAIDLFGAEGAHFGTMEPVKNMIYVARFPVVENPDGVVNWNFKLEEDWEEFGLTEVASGTYQVPYKDEILQAEFREGEDVDGVVYRSILLMRRDGEGHEISVGWFGPGESATEARFLSMFE